ncbi:hypothetical protein D9M71_360520 [compost metagenome]
MLAQPHFPGHIHQPRHAQGGIEHEASEAGHRPFAIALQQVVDEHLGFAEVVGKVVHALLGEPRQRTIASGDGGQQVVIDRAVEGEHGAVGGLRRVTDLIGDIAAGSRGGGALAAASRREQRQDQHGRAR